MQKFSESFKSMEFVNLIINSSTSEKKPSVFEWLKNKLIQENKNSIEKKLVPKIYAKDKIKDKAELKLTEKCQDLNDYQIPEKQLRQEKSNEVQVLAQNIKIK